MTPTQIELLAPAKDLECGTTAIDCGADAVYIGAPRFGARQDAGNSIDDIESLVSHAHKYHAKVYATLNTILHTTEVPQALGIATRLYEIGVDAIIIQDAAFLECDLPPVPLIASTQMHNNTPERVAFLADCGIKRAILARELTLDEIKAIREKTNIELECFVHGAICVCYSGQCYLSYAIGGRSGNRGECAQPCRMPYTLRDKSGKVIVKDKHLLSIRDMNYSDYISDMIDAGVSAFKIEGRLKNRTYVANVVAHYRQIIDKTIAEKGLKKASSGTSDCGFAPDVNKTFNRGYSHHFINGRDAKIGSHDTPKMVGEYVGTVRDIKAKKIFLDTMNSLDAGDGISFYTPEGTLGGTKIEKGFEGMFMPRDKSGMRPGTKIYRNLAKEFIDSVERARPKRTISIDISLEDSTSGLTLTAKDEDGVVATVDFDMEKTPADKPERALETIKKQFAKTGDSVFSVETVDVNTKLPYFLPISVLNDMRRNLLDALLAKRTEERPTEKRPVLLTQPGYYTDTMDFRGNVLNDFARKFYARAGVSQIENAAESGISLVGRRVMTCRYCIRYELDMCPKTNETNDSSSLYLENEDGKLLRLDFDCARCEMGVTPEDKT